MRYFSLLFTILLFSSCSTVDERAKPKEPTDKIRATYLEAVDRLFASHLENNWVVSRYLDGDTEHEGDSLLWTGIAMASLPCELGDVIEDAMAATIRRNGGALVRYEPLGEYANGREITFDGATGLYFGIFNRLENCGDTAMARWRNVWGLHLDYLQRNDWRFHANADASMPPGFNVLRDYISHILGLGDKPVGSRIRLLESEAAAWSVSVIESGKPCYPAHLSFLYMLFLEKSGDLLKGAADTFCYATEEASMPWIDHWCGRKDISKWVSVFEYDKWEYRHQRCGSHETPDGKPRLMTPALDLIAALAYAYPKLLELKE